MSDEIVNKVSIAKRLLLMVRRLLSPGIPGAEGDVRHRWSEDPTQCTIDVVAAGVQVAADGVNNKPYIVIAIGEVSFARVGIANNADNHMDMAQVTLSRSAQARCRVTVFSNNRAEVELLQTVIGEYLFCAGDILLQESFPIQDLFVDQLSDIRMSKANPNREYEGSVNLVVSYTEDFNRTIESLPLKKIVPTTRVSA